MKKILLVVLLALSLNAGGIICEDSQERAVKHHQLMIFASERKDYYFMGKENDLAIKYLERAIASCGYNENENRVAAEFRDALLNISKTLKKL